MATRRSVPYEQGDDYPFSGLVRNHFDVQELKDIEPPEDQINSRSFYIF